MKIRFRQSGGVAHLTLSCEIDTHALPQTEAAEIENLVKISGVLKPKKIEIGSFLKCKFALSRIVACDIFGYSISVESSEVSYRVAFDDFTIPKRGRLLLDYLKKHARPQPHS
jgi:hypothetical protein